MKAYVRLDASTQEVRLSEMPKPQVGPDEVLIEVKAFGVGIHDRYFIPMNITFPYVIGSEGAGIIAETGRAVADFKTGDFTTILQSKGGSWAEYAVANASTLIPLPENLTFAQGAALPIAGKTALESVRKLGLEKGDRLFIAGASGAIGTLVIQLEAKKGIRVAASASARNHDYMKELGAEKVVDYKNSSWTEEVKTWADNKGVTAALAIQPGTGADSVRVVADGGLLITVSGDNASVLPQRGVDIRQMGHQEETAAKMADLVSAVSKGDIKVVIEKEFPFEEALEALRKTETRRARGKLVVVMNA